MHNLSTFRISFSLGRAIDIRGFERSKPLFYKMEQKLCRSSLKCKFSCFCSHNIDKRVLSLCHIMPQFIDFCNIAC